MRIRGIPAREWPAVGAALMVLVVVEIGLRVSTLPRLSRALGVPLDVGDEDATPADYLTLPRHDRIRLRAADRATRRWPFGDTCLRRALVGGFLLRRRRPTLHLGVALTDGQVKAHAWLVIDGRSLDPIGSATYLRLGPTEGAHIR